MELGFATRCGTVIYKMNTEALSEKSFLMKQDEEEYLKKLEVKGII